jgi:hypothetical protein
MVRLFAHLHVVANSNTRSVSLGHRWLMGASDERRGISAFACQ